MISCSSLSPYHLNHFKFWNSSCDIKPCKVVDHHKRHCQGTLTKTTREIIEIFFCWDKWASRYRRKFTGWLSCCRRQTDCARADTGSNESITWSCTFHLNRVSQGACIWKVEVWVTLKKIIYPCLMHSSSAILHISKHSLSCHTNLLLINN